MGVTFSAGLPILTRSTATGTTSVPTRRRYLAPNSAWARHCVMLVQWRAQAEFGAKYRLLVGTEVVPVAVDLVKIGKPAEKVTPIRTARHGSARSHRAATGVRIR